MMMSAFVVSQISKGDWQVSTADGVASSGHRNWALAEEFARTAAIAVGAEVIRLSAKDGRIVSRIRPRAASPVCLRNRTSSAIPSAYVNLAAELAAESGVMLMETTLEDVTSDIAVIDPNDFRGFDVNLNEMSVGDLVTLYNSLGGNIASRYKGGKLALIEKIRARQA
ncbi:MAG: hypothetical protein HC836_10675 [Richelia sp. RM2_1_2]|nr:hypothetical protein [Richelia sp. RM2_1_2]